MSNLKKYNFLLPVLGFVMLLLIAGTFPGEQKEKPDWDENTPVEEVLSRLGKEQPLHDVGKIDSTLAQKGEEILKKGRTTKPNGRSTSRQSKFFTCTDCHNVEREDPDLSVSDPEARLDYAKENDLPFLPGTTLYGVVNRTNWYNDDYVKKYGELAINAHDTLRNAIQLCATECSQGRLLDDWEMKAVLHYLWTIQLEMDDLNASPEMIDSLKRAVAAGKNPKKWREQVKSKFLTGSPAHHTEPLNDPQRDFGANANPRDGKYIYENGCMHCHQPGGETRFVLDHSSLTFNKLKKKMEGHNKFSIYWITRWGTSPELGYRPYMPFFTKERMSDAQIEDLAAYINKQTGGS